MDDGRCGYRRGLRLEIRTGELWRVLWRIQALKETYTCAKIMFSLMTRHRHPDGKFFVVGGAIAKFLQMMKQRLPL